MNLLIIGNPIFSLSDHELAQIENAAPNARISHIDMEQVTDDHLRETNVIYGWPNPKRLHLASKLKWLHAPSAGVDRYGDRSIYANADVIVTRSKDVFNIQIAEHIIMLFLALSRGLTTSINAATQGKWTRISGQLELSGSTVLIVGAGAIGSELAKQLQGFNCRIIGIKNDPSAKPPHYDEMYAAGELDAQLPRADYAALCLPNTETTKGMFNHRRFSLMKRTAIIVNIGRGNAIVTDDIIYALREGLIYGSGLDVTDPEPLPSGHPLWNAPNTIITSHTSGSSVNANTRRFNIFLDLWKRYNEGQPLHSILDFSKGY